MKTFTNGQKLTARSICNHDCIFEATVIKRTAKTVTINEDGTEKRCKIHTNNQGEFIYPDGRYSMATIFRA